MNESISRMRSTEWMMRAQRLPHARPQFLERRVQKPQTLHVVYMMTHVGVCGGVKVIFEHVNGLKRLGAQVTIVSHFPKPEWHTLEADYVCVPFQLELASGIPPCDVIVATYWDHIHACTERGIAPVVYFEQGDFYLYDREQDNVSEQFKEMVRKQYALPPYLCTVSTPIAKIIGDKFGRDAAVFPNALDGSIFFPKCTKSEKKYMMIVGSEQTGFKGIADLKEVYRLVRQRGYDIDLLWITQQVPLESEGEVIVNPPQKTIGELYRQAFVYVCGSYYEAFPLPPLEAMACGTPVVTTGNVGAMEYCCDGVNCLMTHPGDVKGLANHVIQLLDNSDLYLKLQQAGYQTAAAYQWDKILADLLTYYKNIAEFVPVAKNKNSDWIKRYAASDLLNSQEQDQLDTFLAHTDADKVLFPVVRHNTAYPMVSWEPLATRKTASGSGYTIKVGWRIEERKITTSWCSSFVARLYGQGEYEQALQEAQKKLDTIQDPLEQAVCIRWLVLCLMQLKIYNLALDFTEMALAKHPLYTDLMYLAAEISIRCGSKEKAQVYLDKCMIIQDAALYPEHISDIAARSLALLNEMNLNV